MFCTSVSGYNYMCSKFITAPMIHDRGSGGHANDTLH